MNLKIFEFEAAFSQKKFKEISTIPKVFSLFI